MYATRDWIHIYTCLFKRLLHGRGLGSYVAPHANFKLTFSRMLQSDKVNGKKNQFI